MSKSISSPTARMLRSSRLFSMPPPLPPPSVDLLQRSGAIKTSETATHPYPTRQAITAPASSRYRGDWGLKRPLPQKTNSTSTPHVRINAMDTLEHITDFDSATDHTLSYAKWQEMSIPLYTKPTENTGSGNNYGAPARLTAFNERTDHTIIHETMTNGTSSINALPLGYDRATRTRAQNTEDVKDKFSKSRWKYEGPDLVSMTQSDFESFLRSDVEVPKIQEEFQRFLWTVLKWRNQQDAQMNANKGGQQASEATEQDAAVQSEESSAPRENTVDAAAEQVNGEILEQTTSDEQSASVQATPSYDPNPEQFHKWMMELRSSPQNLSTELSNLIRDFFDLPPFPKEISINQDKTFRKLTDALGKDMTPARTAPTHPSAGLSYLRTNAFMENHSVHGPQADRTPVEARLLRPRSTGFSDFSLVGVGGFSAKDRTNKSHNNFDPSAKWDFSDPSKNKTWMKPHFAYIDADGKINLELERAGEEPIAVAGGGPDPRKAVPDLNNKATRDTFKVLSNAAARGEQQNQKAAPEYRTLTPAKGYHGGEQKLLSAKIKAGASGGGSVFTDVLRQALQGRPLH